MNRRSVIPLFGLFFFLTASSGVFAQSVFVEDFASSPAASSVSARSQGRKGMRVLFGGTSGQFPIDVSGATVTLTINGAPHNCAFNVRTPVNNDDCGFVPVRFDQTALHPQVDTVEPCSAPMPLSVTVSENFSLTLQSSPVAAFLGLPMKRR